MSFDELHLHDDKKFWHARIADETLWVRSGKLGSQGRERSVKPSSAEGKRGNLRAELRGRAWKQIRKGYRYDPQDDQRGPLRWIVPAPDFMAIGARGLSACRDGSYAVFEQHSNGKGSRVYRLDLETGERRLAWEGSSFLLRGVWALDADTVLYTPETREGWNTCELDLNGGGSRLLASGKYSMLGTILGADAKGERVLAAVDEQEFAVLDRASGRELLRGPVPPTKHNQGRACALSPDGSLVVMAAPPASDALEQERSRITIYEVDSGDTRSIETSQNLPFDALVWLGSDRLALLERFSEAQIWQVRPTLEPGRRLSLDEEQLGFYMRPAALAASANGRYVALYDGAGALAVLDADSGEHVFAGEHRLFGQRGAVEFASGGVIVTSGGGMLGRWDTGLKTES